MTNLWSNFILDIIGEAGDFFNFALAQISLLVFNIEKFILVQGNAVGINLDKMRLVLYGAGLSLLTVNCLMKGFEQYILWSDGDPDNPPVEMLVRMAKAIAIAACFPSMYRWLVDIAIWLTNQLLSAITTLPPAFESIKGIIESTILLGSKWPFLGPLMVLIYLILLIVLFVQFMKKGVEMLVMRLGVPLGVIGFLNSDGGISKNYFKIFYQCALTVSVQLVLFKFSISLWMNAVEPLGAIIAIVVMGTAVSAPKFIAQFLVQSGGGGGHAMSNMYFASSFGAKAKSLFMK